jgi:16S rRNA (cytosine967-C5)-methyltransferase
VGLTARQRLRKLAPGHGARRAAAAAYHAVTGRGVVLDEALAVAAASQALDDRDHAFARSIVTVALKQAGRIAGALEARLSRGMPRKSGELPAILATAAAQILFLEAADHAAVDAAVTHAKSDHRSAGYAGLANAVLRGFARDKSAILALPGEALSGLPRWLALRWERHYGRAAAERMAESLSAEVHVDLQVKSDPAGWAERLSALLLPSGALRVADRRGIAELPGYADGAWWVQDAAAALAAQVIPARAGMSVIDLCAAPGGKTAQLAARGAEVIAVDTAPERLARLEANMKRLQLTARIVLQDAMQADLPPAEAVLLDAPCSATGTLRRHPDIAYVKRESDIARLAGLQGKLIDRAATLVRRGGMLVYATCSLEPEEGESVVAAFLGRSAAFRRAPISAQEVPGFADAVSDLGELRIMPWLMPHATPRLAGVDGFFVSRLQRVS